jgi:rubredoxin
VNLSCGNCKTIRWFTGEPPKCDVCGWVYNASERKQPVSSNTKSSDTASGFGCLVALGAVALLIWSFLPDSWTDPWKYSVIYSANSDNVHVTDKPKDCDFIHAPLGDKACHYKKVIYGYNSRGDFVAGDNAPQYSTNTQNKPIISYDGGKSWQLLPDAQNPPDTKVVKIEVDWEKVKE